VLGCPITDVALPHLARLTGLKSLMLAATNLSGNGLGQLHTLDRLEIVNLDHVPVTDTTLQELRTLGGLKTICVRGTQVSDQAAAQLQQALPGCTIER